MNYLIDTHILLWCLFAPKNLSGDVARIIDEPNNKIFVSTLSFWEIALKYSLNKLDLVKVSPEEFLSYVVKARFEIIDLMPETAISFYKLPIYKNKDPFDRMLAWQAIQRDLLLISKDKGFDLYVKDGLRRIW